MPGTFETKENRIKCRAHSKQTKNPCKFFAIPGGTVCRYHGGLAPQVQDAARRRLAIMVAPALEKLASLINSEMDAVALATVKDILDRNGYKAPEEIRGSLVIQIDKADAEL